MSTWARTLEALLDVPQPDVDLESDDGRGEWHENAEVRSLRRAMTAEEQADHAGYDRSLYRGRQSVQDALRSYYGDVWMLVPKRENRHRAWVPDRILKAVA